MAVPKVITPETLSTWSVETLAELANDAGERAQKVAKQAVQHAIVAGNALNAAKSQIPHGEWMAWVKSNWNYSQDWANKLMRLASNSESTLNLDQAETISEALELVDGVATEDDDATESAEPETFTDSAPEPPAKPSRKSEPRDVEPYSIDDMEKEIRRAICSWFKLVPESQYDELHGTIIEQLNERWVVR